MSPRRGSATFGRCSRQLILAIALGSSFAATGLDSSPAAPLPDRDTFLREVRRRIRDNEPLITGYTYHEQITDYQRDAGGSVTRQTKRLYKVRPDNWGVPIDWILIAKNGVPVAPEDIAREERAREERIVKARDERARERPVEQAKRRAREAQERREEDEAIDEVFRVCHANILRREMVAGRSTVVVGFEPKPGADARSLLGKVLGRSKGQAWFDEVDFQLVRLDVQSIDTITYGWGLVARIHPGVRLVFDRRLVNGEVWLPAGYRLTGTLRLFVLKESRLDREVQFSEYRKE